MCKTIAKGTFSLTHAEKDIEAMEEGFPKKKLKEEDVDLNGVRILL